MPDSAFAKAVITAFALAATFIYPANSRLLYIDNILQTDCSGSYNPELRSCSACCKEKAFYHYEKDGA